MRSLIGCLIDGGGGGDEAKKDEDSLTELRMVSADGEAESKTSVRQPQGTEFCSQSE